MICKRCVYASPMKHWHGDGFTWCSKQGKWVRIDCDKFKECK